MGRQTGGKRLDLGLLAPRHMQRHLLAAGDGLRGKRGKLAEVLQLGPLGNPGGKQRAEGIHIRIELRQLGQRQPIELRRQFGRLIGKGHGQMMIWLILPPASVAGEQSIQLLKTLSQHECPCLAVKKEAHSSDPASNCTLNTLSSVPRDNTANQ